MSKLKGCADPAMPAFVGLSPKMGHMPWADAGQPGFLGVAHAPFKPDRAKARPTWCSTASRSTGWAIARPC